MAGHAKREYIKSLPPMPTKRRWEKSLYLVRGIYRVYSIEPLQGAKVMLEREGGSYAGHALA